jgi:hypothetical protein
VKQQLQSRNVSEYAIFTQLISTLTVCGALCQIVFNTIFCSVTIFQIQSDFFHRISMEGKSLIAAALKEETMELHEQFSLL